MLGPWTQSWDIISNSLPENDVIKARQELVSGSISETLQGYCFKSAKLLARTNANTSRLYTPLGFLWCFLRSSVYFVCEPRCQDVGAAAVGEGKTLGEFCFKSLSSLSFCPSPTSPWVSCFSVFLSLGTSSATTDEAVLKGSWGPVCVRLKKAMVVYLYRRVRVELAGYYDNRVKV